MITVATLNVNLIRARKERVLRWLGKVQPEIMCLQELKVAEADFPLAEIRDLGYHVAISGQRTYNGVAILSKQPVESVEISMNDGENDPAARFVAATTYGIRVVCAYVPNGETIHSEKYPYKLRWMERLIRYVTNHNLGNQRALLCGDFNTAPAEIDVAKPAMWLGSVLTTSDVRMRFQRLLDSGFEDVFRKLHPEDREYSWWDYRSLGFLKNDGLRIDFLLASTSLAPSCKLAWIDREERKGEKTSDHAPVIAQFEV